MSFLMPGDVTRDTLTDQIWALCYCASRGDVNKLKDYIHQEGIMLNFHSRIGASALIQATEQGHVKALRTLIAAGVDVNMSQSENKTMTPLMTAAERGDVDCLIALIESGARVNMARYDGQTPLTLAILEGCSEDVKSAIGAETNPRVRSSMGSLVVINRTWKEQHEECALLLLQAGAEINYTNDSGYSLLMYAAANGSIKLVKAILQAGGNVNQAANDGTTALLLACRCTTQLDFRLYKLCVDVLLQAGAKVDATNLERKTALILAVQNSVQYKKFQRTDIIQLLIQSGTNPDIQDKEGMTALIYAAAKNLARFCELLINHSANVSIQDKVGRTAYMYTTDSRCLQVILSTQVNILTSKLNYTGSNKVYSHLYTDLNIQDKDGKTALIYAAQYNLTNCCELLINHNCDVNLQDKSGRTALMYASKPACLQTLITEPAIDLLFHSVANPNIQDNSGKTALMHAAEQNLASCCELLLSHFAEVDMQDSDGKTALMYASKRDTIQVILSNGANTELLDDSNCTALVHLLKHQKQLSDVIDNITVLLEYGANPVIDICHRHLLMFGLASSKAGYLVNSLVTEGRRHLIRLLVCNGIVAHTGRTLNVERGLISPLGCALTCGHVDIAKYFIANCYLSEADMRDIRRLSHAKSQLYSPDIFCDSNNSAETHLFLQQIRCQPWPLVKLAFIAVSSAVGTSPEREQRISQTRLPPRLQRMLMFQEPVSHLPVNEWFNIPLSFEPAEYERMPKPRPLLYYWPFGRDLVI